MTKNIQISFRLSKYQLAHGLEILKGLEPSYAPSSLTSMVKLIVEDWIAKMSAATKPWPSVESQRQIEQIMIQTAAGRKAREGQRNGDELARIMKEKAKQVTQVTQRPATETRTETEAQLQVNSASVKTIVTDFRPPSMEELINQEEEL